MSSHNIHCPQTIRFKVETLSNTIVVHVGACMFIMWSYNTQIQPQLNVKSGILESKFNFSSVQ